MSESPDAPTKARSDPFSALGLTRRFDVEDAEIERAFLARLGGVHPDVAGEDGSMDAAALIEARSVLLDAESRAGTLLGLLGGPAASVEKSLPDGFLMEMMELRGVIEDELAEGEGARARWEAFAGERRAGHIERAAEMFRSLGDPADGDALRAIRVELNAWRYTERLIEQLDPAHDPDRADLTG